MRGKLVLFTVLTLAAAGGETRSRAQQPFTLQQILSAPYASELTAAPVGARFAWVENAEGVRNLWVGGADTKAEPARAITHYTEDDGQDINGLAWSPDGGSIAYVYGAENGASGKPANPAHLQRPTALQVIVQPLAAGAAPVVIGEGHAPLFTRDGKSLLFVRAGQIWIAPLATDAAGASPAAPHQLVFDRGSAGSLTLSPDGKLLAYVSSRRSSDESRSFIALYDFAAKALRLLSPSAERDFAPAFSPDGKQIAWLRAPVNEAPEFVNERVSANPWSIQLADVAGGKARTVFEPEANKPGSVLPHLATGSPNVMWAAGGKLVFFSEADGWVHLYALVLPAAGPPELLTPGEFEVEDAAVKTEKVFYTSNQVFAHDEAERRLLRNTLIKNGTDDQRHLWKMDLSKAHARPEVLAGDLYDTATHPQPSADGQSLAALVGNAWYPSRAATIANNGIGSPFHAEAPANPNFNILVSPPSQTIFRSADKLLDVHGQLFLPNGNHSPPDARHPAIIFVHGGPRRQMLLGYPAMDYYSNAYAMNQYLASRGFIVLSVNYRCGIGYGLDFRQCEGQGAAGAKEYNDVLAAQKYLASRPDVDVKRIGIWGGSYGGYLTALALARNSDLFAAGVDFHGVHEWALEDNAPTDWLRGTVVEREKIEALAHASSPMADIDKWKSPVLLIHGDDDPEVAYAQTPLLAEALRARGVPVETLIFPDEVHGFLLHKDWLAAYEATAAFFERTLHPETVK